MAISGNSGANVNPEIQKKNIEEFATIINHIEKEILSLEESLTNVVTLGLNGSSVQDLVNNYQKNREAINSDVKAISMICVNLGINLNKNIEADEAFKM